MVETITRTETYDGVELAYKFDALDGGVAEVEVTATKAADGYNVNVKRNYWRDMTYSPTQSKAALSDEVNAHIAEAVKGIWESYPDVSENKIVDKDGSTE